MYTFRTLPACHAVEVGEHGIAKEWSDGRHQDSDLFQAFIQSLECADLVMLILTFPEPSAAETHIPVAKVFVYKFFDRSSRLCRFIIVHEILHLLYKRVQR